MNRRTILSWLILLLAVACAHGGGKPALTFQATVPEGWREVPNEDAMLFMTRDGGYKQFVLIRERPASEPFQFSKRSLNAQMTPAEAAALVVEELALDNQIREFHLIENQTASIAGNPGFRLVFTYTDADGFVFKTIYCGFIRGETYYTIRYGATREEYFSQDLKTFEEVMKSFRLVAAR
ncbi:MAG: hypothetical protein WHT06_07195 [Desulfobacterales bacterium]